MSDITTPMRPMSELLPAPPMSREEKYFRKHENLTCGEMAEREGDRLLKLGDLLGAEVAHRISALIRIRRDTYLEPF